MTDIAMDSMVIKSNRDGCGKRHLPFVSPEGKTVPTNLDGTQKYEMSIEATGGSGTVLGPTHTLIKDWEGPLMDMSGIIYMGPPIIENDYLRSTPRARTTVIVSAMHGQFSIHHAARILHCRRRRVFKTRWFRRPTRHCARCTWRRSSKPWDARRLPCLSVCSEVSNNPHRMQLLYAITRVPLCCARSIPCISLCLRWACEVPARCRVCARRLEGHCGLCVIPCAPVGRQRFRRALPGAPSPPALPALYPFGCEQPAPLLFP